MILIKYKNKLLTTIKESGLDPILFTVSDRTLDKENFFIIELRNSPIIFAVRPWDTFSQFEARHSRFEPSFPLARSFHTTILPLLNQFKWWLNNVVKPYLDESSTPDLWQILEHARSDSVREIEDPNYSLPFSQEEKDQIKQSIEQLRRLIANKFNVQEKQLRTITNLLNYLSDAVDKHNKFDWRGIAINVAFNIALHLALNPDETRQFFQLFTGVFSNITHLLP